MTSHVRQPGSIFRGIGIGTAILIVFLGAYGTAYWYMVRAYCYSMHPPTYGPFYSLSDDNPADYQEYWTAFFTPAHLVDRTIRREEWAEPLICFSDFEFQEEGEAEPERVVEVRVHPRPDTPGSRTNPSDEPESDDVVETAHNSEI